MDEEQILADINKHLGAIHEKLDSHDKTTNSNFMKIFYSLIGVGAATIGVKFVGTSPLVWGIVFLGLFSIPLGVGMLIHNRRMF